MEPDTASLLAQIDSLGKDLSADLQQDRVTRRQLRIAAGNLYRVLDEPGDVMERVCFQFTETVSIRIAINLNLFNILEKSVRPLKLTELATATSADPVLLAKARILRSLGSIGAVAEVNWDGEEAYAPTKMSKTFTIPGVAAGVEFCFDVLSPSYNALPAYLAAKNYVNPTEVTDSAFHVAHHTTEHLMGFLATKPDSQKAFHLFMDSGYTKGRSSWMDTFPVKENLGTDARDDPAAIMFVDIGGGMGQEAVALKKRFADLPGRFVVQDMPQIVSKHNLNDGIESMAHDFFTPQPVEGARVYYLRHILHNWNDARCHLILKHIQTAMDPSYSKVLIQQWVVPTQHATPTMTHMDLTMMATLSAMERTEPQMRALLEGAGLRIAHIWKPADVESECTIEAVVC